MKSIKTILIIMSAMLMAQFSQARTLEIEVRDYTDVLPIKQLIKEERPNIKLKNFDLQSVEVIARGRANGVRARLMIDGQREDAASFRKDRQRQSSVFLRAYRSRFQADGAWRVKMSDYVDVKYIIVNIKRERGGDHNDGPGRLRSIDLGSKKASKIGRTSDFFYANERKVWRVTIAPVSGNVRVENVWAHTFSGRRVNLNDAILRQQRRNGHRNFMPVTLRGHDKLVAKLGRALNIDTIEVEAYSTRLNGSRSVYQVKLGVEDRF